MIILKTTLPDPVIFKLVERAIERSYPKGAEWLAAMGASKMREAAPFDLGGLRDSIKTLPGTGRTGYGRTDIVIGGGKIWYWAWQNWGSDTPTKLPYSKTGKPDFRKSKYKGKRYIETGIVYMGTPSVYGLVITEAIKIELAKLKGMKL